MTPQALAEAASQAMWSRDRASKWLGLSLDHVGPGEARLSMVVEDHHLQGHDICHGGFIFTLADSAFAFACNSHNDKAVAQHNTISFLAPGALGDRLTAHAREVSRVGRTGLYDVTVTNQNGEVIAEFRGASRQVRGQHIDVEDTP